MHLCAFGESKNRLTRVPVVPVLMNGVSDGLASERVFELDRYHRNTVDRQHHIQRLFVLRAKTQLPSEPQAIGLVARL
ncbi:hypothetical protein D3C77_304520 [compost metagenome]